MSLLPNFFSHLRRNPKRLSQIKWAHRANFKKRFFLALSYKNTDALEIDLVSMPGVSVRIGHDLHDSSDLDLGAFFEGVKTTKKIIKLDFKDPGSLQELGRIVRARNLWIKNKAVIVNADVLKGPGGVEAKFSPKKFFRLARKNFPFAAISLGWTTSLSKNSSGYTQKDLSRMMELIRYFRKTRKEKFFIAVRASFFRQSRQSLRSLLFSRSVFLSFWESQIQLGNSERQQIYKSDLSDKSWYDF